MYIYRRTSIIQDMRSQLQPRLSLFEIHVNPVIKPPLRPVSIPQPFRTFLRCLFLSGVSPVRVQTK